MKRKHYILGILATLCFLGTGGYAWSLHDAYLKQVAEWNEGAKAAFEEALWMEVNKRAEIPMYSVSSGEKGVAPLNARIPDSVAVMTKEGFRKYKIDRNKYERSLIKEMRARTRLSTLLKQYPLQIDTLTMHWDSLVSEKNIPVSNKVRYISTDLKLQNDTICSLTDSRLRFDSLSVSYLGFRCEHELTAFVSYPSWLQYLSRGNWFVLMFPWVLLILLFLFYPNLKMLAKRKLMYGKVIERTVEVEKEVIIENKIYVVDVQADKADVFELPDGTIFDTIVGTLNRDGLQQRLQPQSILLLKLFLSRDNRLVASDEICMQLWGNTQYSYRLYSAVSRLRNDLKAVKSKLSVYSSRDGYELKLPISSKNSEI